MLVTNPKKMNIVTGKQESVYDLIRSMSKAEKRNFKLYATRLSGNQEAKFISLFDCMDALDNTTKRKSSSAARSRRNSCRT